jgi:hypothetical protein
LNVCYTQLTWQTRTASCHKLSPTYLADLSSTYHQYASSWLVSSQLFAQLYAEMT